MAAQLPTTPARAPRVPRITPTRRNIFGHLAGMMAAGGILYSGIRRTPAHPDGELLDLVRQFAAHDAAATARYFGDMAAIDDELPHPAFMAAAKPIMARSKADDVTSDEMLHHIAALPATTVEGRAAKARVVERWLSDCWDVVRLDRASPWEKVALSLAGDAGRSVGV